MKRSMKKRIIYLLLSVSFIGFPSCSDDYLDRLPDTQIPESQGFFNTEAGLESFTNSFYSYFSATSIKNDHTSDNCEHFAAPPAIRTQVYTLPTALGSGGWDWTAIRNVNYFIEKCEASTVSADVKNEYLGVAKFFRALLYWGKVKTFGDVPWYSKPLSTNDVDEIYKARDARTLVMDSVLNDLNQAIEYLPKTKYHNRISKWTALAFKSRICLYEATWRKYHTSYNLSDATKFFKEAANAAKEVIDGGAYSLYSTGLPAEDYRMLFLTTTASSDETILAISFPQDKTGGGIDYDNDYTTTSNGNYGGARSLMEDYFMSDGSSFNNRYSADEQEVMAYADEMKDRDPRLSGTIIIPGYVRYGTTTSQDYGDFTQNRTGYQICKRVGPETYTDYRDIILMRYAEVLLNYAEAETELGNCNQELLDKTINKIRTRAGLPARTYPMTTDQHQRDMYKQIASNSDLCEIRHERRVELAMEGLRYDDLVRWGEGHLFRETYEGIYIGKGIGQPIDLDNDGAGDVCFVRTMPTNPQSGLTYVVLQSGNGFSNGDDKGGRIIPYNKTYAAFNDWEYLNPIPSEEITLNPKLEQNPGWDQFK